MFLLLQTDYLIPMFRSSLAIMGLFAGYKLLLIPFGFLFLILLVLFFRRCRKMKRKKQQIAIPPVTQIIGSDSEQLEELNKDLAPFGFKYEPYQDIFYSLLNSWQRDFGYCRLYDEATAPLSMIIDCEPIRFEYAGKRWMIEFWKGQYGMTTGGEVGIYYTDGPELNIPGVFNGTFYYCVKDEDRINMSFALRKNGNLLFTRHGYHWWLTGFKLGEFSHPEELTMDIMLDLYDKEMVNAFVDALKKVGYKENEFAVHGRRVYVHFGKPHTPQPLTRTSFTEFIMQKNNENLCRMYAHMTADYTDTLDKIEIIRQNSPDMYNQILNIGKSKGVFESFKKIKGFLSNKEINGKE
jgi:hypothetical protein